MTGSDESRWANLLGGYRVLYDPRPALAKLEGGDHDGAFAELWNELHHQGDVDTASYAAVPELVRVYKRKAVPDWNVYALAGTIELQRGLGDNPELPSWLEPSYREALSQLAQFALEDIARTEDPDVARSALAIIALTKNLRDHARILLDFDQSEVKEFLSQVGW
jgi:hypothetical protein